MEPKLKSLRLRDFRSVSGEWLVPLDADVVLIHGQNGAGKTSLLSALELAATGRISYLDRLGDLSYQKHLNHRGTRSGEVALEVTGLRDQAVGSVSVTGEGVKSEPLFANRQLAETFVERCFLPQATLSRLFEVYAPRQTTAETPMVRFVKEVLGLDALDALIDGLYQAGHIRRAQKASMRWKATASDFEELSDRLEKTVLARRELQGRFGEVQAALAAHIGVHAEVVDDGRPGQISTKVRELEALQADNDSQAAVISSMILQIEAIQATLEQENLLTFDPNEFEVRPEATAAEDRYLEWKESRSGPLLEWFNEYAGMDKSSSDPRPPELLRAIRSVLKSLESGIAESRRNIARLFDVNKKLGDSRDRVAEVEETLERLTAQRASASDSSAAAGLASVLVSMLEYVDGETCPLCDQGFSGSLRAHVSEKIEGLNTNAARLIELETRRARLEAEQKAMVQEIADDEALSARFGDLTTVESQLREQVAEFGRLKVLEPVGEAGLLLWDALNKLRDADSESVRRRNLLQRCLADLEYVAHTLGAQPPRGLLAQQVASLRAIAHGQLEELESVRRHTLEAVRRKSELDGISEQVDSISARIDEFESRKILLSSQIEDATARKKFASDLCKQAEELRSSITARVFDEQLNGAWSRIFGVLVPSEPFIPQFKNASSESRRVRVDLETRHRDGMQGATPAAMLSQGNLNTAALSLFIALHFAVPPQLPWLIFDDPVQSMDDLHVSNFAALVKQLTRRNGRQVLIAVHDRELFDYLSLELAPASTREELLAITLDRTYGQSVITHERLRFEVDVSLSPSPAA